MSHPDDGVLQELLDGELAPADEAAVRAHLAACAACAALLDELRATQLEATAIVSRLELDPPLRRAAPRRPGLRRGNLRLLALAASTVLVAGTSWLLLRTSPEADRFYRLADSGAPAMFGPPAAPPARLTAPAETETDEHKAPADAAPVVSVAESARQHPKLKEETAAPARPAAPLAGALSAAAANRASDAVVSQEAPAPSLTVADAEARLGWKVHTIEGLTPQSVELVPAAPDAAPGLVSGVRQRYQVGSVSVILVQQAVSSGDVSLRGGRVDDAARERAAAAEPAGGALKKDGAQAPAKMLAGSAVPMRVWRSGGLMFELSGALPADSLDALRQRVR